MSILALLTWPLLALIVFARLPLPKAIIIATIVPYLYLPEAFEIPLPALPDLDKTSIIAVGLILGVLFFGRKTGLPGAAPEIGETNRHFFWFIRGCLIILLVGVCFTVQNNSEGFWTGAVVLPGMRPWDAIGFLGKLVLTLTPFWFARRHLATLAIQREFLKVLVWGGVIYSFLMLIEIRLSPQLHKWIYGYFQHSFLQHIRDGFRPMVFLQHGLWVGFFMLSATIAAFALWKSSKNKMWLGLGVWLFLVLMISKNLGAFAICIVLLGIFWLTRQRTQLIVIAVIAGSVLVYPALRNYNLIPLDSIMNWANSVSADRAQSFGFRLENEDRLLDHTWNKPLTGWGGYGRNRVYSEDGNNITVTDGLWIIILSEWGWVGYLAYFGLLTIPAIFLVRVNRHREVPPEIIACGLICAGNLIYMIPNATLTPVGFLTFGTLVAFIQYKPQESAPIQDATSTAPKRRNRYSRFSGNAANKPALSHRR